MTADLSYQTDSPLKRGTSCNPHQSQVKAIKKFTKSLQILLFINNLEQGNIPWHRPWINIERPKNLVTGKEYRGINLLLTSCQGFTTPLFLTFKQCKDMGGSVKKGEKGTPIVYWNWINKTVKDPDTDEDMEKSIPFLRYYTVFNLEQTEGLNISYCPVTFDFNPIDKAEQIVKNMPLCPPIKHIEQQAYYSPTLDYINMPRQDSFKIPEGYYATLFHELSHSTGHESRLNRQTINDLCPFGSTNYSKEELIAEMSACSLCASIGIENKTIDNSYAYINGWIRKFRDKSKMIIVAAAQAEKASDYILNSRRKTQ